MSLSPCLKRVQMARTALLLDQPFFGVLALQLKLLEDPTAPTAWTDGAHMAFNPAFVDRLSQEELKALIAHEVMHCACGHPWRRNSREPLPWNVAADYAINGILRDAHFQLPAGALLDTQYDGKWAEWIYDRLPRITMQPGSMGEGMGEVRDAQTGQGPDGQAPVTEADWQQATQQSLQQAKARGKLPATLEAHLHEVAKPRVDWRSVLRRFVQDLTRSDYSWERPNTRFIPSGLYLPALRQHECGRIAVAVDTSGSIDQVLLQQFAGELCAIADDVKPSAVTVMYCDTKIHREDTFERGDAIDIHAVGRGGTDFRPVFERLESEPPVVLIYLTDMDGAFPNAAPEYPVIWCVSGRTDTAPFGEVVECVS